MQGIRAIGGFGTGPSHVAVTVKILTSVNSASGKEPLKFSIQQDEAQVCLISLICL